jgi:transposase
MGEPHPLPLRERVVKAYEAGEGSYPAIATRFSIGEATAKRWVWRHRETGSVEPVSKRGGTPSAISASELDRLVAQLGDPTANELTAEFNRGRRPRDRVHVSSMKRALHRHGYVVKKNDAGRWSVCGRMCSPDARRS